MAWHTSSKLKFLFLTSAMVVFSLWALLSTAQTRQTSVVRIAPVTPTRSVFVNGQPAGTMADLRPLGAKIKQLLEGREQKAVFLAVDPDLSALRFRDLGLAIQKAGGEVYLQKAGAAGPVATTASDGLMLLVSTDGVDTDIVAATLARPFAETLRDSLRVTFLDAVVQGFPLRSYRAKGSFEIGSSGRYFVNEGPATNFANASIDVVRSTQRPIEKDSLESGFKTILVQHAGILRATEFELRNEDRTFAESVLKSTRAEVNEITIIAPPSVPVSQITAIFDAGKNLGVSFTIVIKPAGQ